MRVSKRQKQRRNARFENVLHYIEAHYSDDLDVHLLARMACISPFHFHRAFSAYIGEPVQAFIRRLRLEDSARCLLFNDFSVTDAALRAGYATSAAFTRAFRRHFSTTPGKFAAELREKRIPGPLVPQLLPADPEYRYFPTQSCLCIQRSGPYAETARQAWTEMAQFLVQKGLVLEEQVRVGIPLDWPELTLDSQLRYQACVLTGLPASGEYFRKTVTGGSYAVFRFSGNYEDLHRAHEAILWNWLPGSGAILRDTPAVFRFLSSSGQPRGASNELAEICIPVESGSRRKVA